MELWGKAIAIPSRRGSCVRGTVLLVSTALLTGLLPLASAGSAAGARAPDDPVPISVHRFEGEGPPRASVTTDAAVYPVEEAARRRPAHRRHHRLHPDDGPVTVRYETTGGTAWGSDYTPLKGEVAFPTGTASGACRTCGSTPSRTGRPRPPRRSRSS
ncbi:hypothetical protein SALBM311S_00180 [Streptomyces alboniger]